MSSGGFNPTDVGAMPSANYVSPQPIVTSETVVSPMPPATAKGAAAANTGAVDAKEAVEPAKAMNLGVPEPK